MTFIKSMITFAFIALGVQIDAGSSTYSKLDFYGHELPIAFDQRMASVKFYDITQREITNKLNAYRGNQLTKMAFGISKYIKAYNLDGAASTLLIDKYAQHVTRSRSSNNKVFIKYLLLKELGYDVLLTKTHKQLNCLGSLSFVPGRYIFINYNNKKYVDLDFKKRKNAGRHTIFIDNNQTKKLISRDLKRVPQINAKKRTRALSFKFGVEKHNLNAISNESITEFLGDLPLFEVGKEFTELHVSKELDASVMQYLREQVADREVVDQVRFLLAFVQQIVPYGSDYDKYGEERFYYPEETIMATTADCEDKAMLLAYLCNDILGLNTVGLYFKKDTHLSLGIEIPNYNPSGSFGYNGKRYVSCEPTASYPRLTQTQFSLERVDEVIEF